MKIPGLPVRITILMLSLFTRWFIIFWGLGGVLLLIGSAVYRLFPVALGTFESSLLPFHWAVLVAYVLFMVYSEGYRGFHKGFSPRVVSRLDWLLNNPRWYFILLAPVFCMGYFYSTLRRKITVYLLTAMIVFFVLTVPYLEQPWRGIIDSGVVLGLVFGMASLAYLFLVWAFTGRAGDPEIPT